MKKQASIIICLTILITLVLHAVSPAAKFNYTTIGHPGASSTNAYGINDFGQIVGEYNLGSVYLAFFYDTGNFTTIDYPGADYLTSLSETNIIGQMVSRYMITVGEEHGFIYEGGSFTTIDYMSYGTALHGINDFSQIVGENGPQFGFLEYDTTFITILSPEGVLRIDAAGINDAEAKPWIRSISTVQKAMTLPSPTDVIPEKKEPQPKTELQMAVAPSPKITPSAEAEIENVDERTVRRENWLLSQDATYYTIQIMGDYNEEILLSFIKKNQLLKQNEIAYYQATFNSKVWYRLLYGIYPTKKEAQLAVNKFPENIRKEKPWISSISTVQKAIRDRLKR